MNSNVQPLKRKLQLRNPEILEPRIAPALMPHLNTSTTTQSSTQSTSDPLFNAGGRIPWQDLDPGKWKGGGVNGYSWFFNGDTLSVYSQGTGKLVWQKDLY